MVAVLQYTTIIKIGAQRTLRSLFAQPSTYEGLVYLLYLSIFTIILAQEKTFSAPRTFLGTATIERNLLISFWGFGLSSGLLGSLQIKFFLTFPGDF